MQRTWAFWRRFTYFLGFFIVFVLLSGLVYWQFIYAAPTCFDTKQNGEEGGIDCGGSCQRICFATIAPPRVAWTRSFEITPGQYNAVAYVENTNAAAGTPEVAYTFALYDASGLITERSGKTVLPPDSVYPIFEGRIATNGRTPTKTILTLDNVEYALWLPSTRSRDQFSVLSRELSAVDTSPRLDAEVTNNTLDTWNNVEVVATIFDVRGNALTASRTYVDAFVERQTQKVTFTWPQPIAKTLRSCEVPTDVVMAIDLSGSMNNDGGTPPEPISSVLAAAKNFADRLKQRDQAALVTFASDAKALTRFTAATAVGTAISGLSIDPEEERGNTNTAAGLEKAARLFAEGGHKDDARKVVVILTDGLATAPKENPEEVALTAAAALKADGVDIYAIGLGQEVNMEFIRKIASEGKSYQAISRDRVNAIYEEITGAICEDGAAVIDIVPKTPAVFDVSDQQLQSRI